MFSGKVAIEIESKEPRDYFLAHVKYLEILSANLTRNGQNIELKEAMEYEPNEFFVFWTRNMEPKGKYIMNFGMLWNINVINLQISCFLYRILEEFRFASCLQNSDCRS